MESKQLEYLCPQCGSVNSLFKHEIKSMFREQIQHCCGCNASLEVIPTNGFGEQINLIVAAHSEEICLR